MVRIYKLKFQFHKGTIKTKRGTPRSCCANQFQFHKGTIKTKEKYGEIKPSWIFQFHKGTIKTLRELYLCVVCKISIP